MDTNHAAGPARTTLALLLGAVLVLSACQSTEPASRSLDTAARSANAQFSNDFTATMDVVAISPSERLVTLRGEDGGFFQVRAGEAVRNFDQIAAGDQLRVRYQETMTASLRPENEAAGGEQAVVAAGRAEAGMKPGAGVGLAWSARVKIESIDREREIVVFSLASGELLAHRVATAEGREFVDDLRIGDTVQLDYAEVLALSIERL